MEEEDNCPTEENKHSDGEDTTNPLATVLRNTDKAGEIWMEYWDQPNQPLNLQKEIAHAAERPLLEKKLSLQQTLCSDCTGEDNGVRGCQPTNHESSEKPSNQAGERLLLEKKLSLQPTTLLWGVRISTETLLREQP